VDILPSAKISLAVTKAQPYSQWVALSVVFGFDLGNPTSLKTNKIIVPRHGAINPLFNYVIHKIDKVDINGISAFLLNHKGPITNFNEIAAAAKTAVGTRPRPGRKHDQPDEQNTYF
jgi:hypothetical protein